MRETIRSGATFFESKKFICGGTSVPICTSDPYPIYISRGKGAFIYDIDGNEYIDLCMGSGSLLLGHAHQELVAAMGRQLELGISYGAPVDIEMEMAKMVRRLFPTMEMMRFTSDGIEAMDLAIDIAKAHTGRSSYVQIGSMASKSSVGGCHVPFNDLDALEAILCEGGKDLAAVSMEPVGTRPFLELPSEDYLMAVREMTERHGTLLIFDENITGMRVAIGGAQRYYGVRPDMTILGRTIGGGMPIGIVGASKEIMRSSPRPIGKKRSDRSDLNPLTLVAGIESIRVMERDGIGMVFRQAERARDGIRSILGELHQGLILASIGSMFQLTFPMRPSMRIEATDGPDHFMNDIYHRLFEKGIFLSPRNDRVNFLSTAHTEKTVDRTIDAYIEVLSEALG